MNLKQTLRCGNLRGFTLVELVVTIAIIAILSTIGFASIGGYFAGARDGVRLADMKNIYGQMNISLGKTGEFPIPENYTTVTLSGGMISYQGTAGRTVLDTIGFEGAGRDPKDDLYYTYSINAKKSKAQILVYFEEFDVKKLSNLPSFVPEAFVANVVDYTNRIPGTMGKKIGILLDSITSAPIYNTAIDVATTTTPYTVYFDNTTEATGTGDVLTISFLTNSISSPVAVIAPVGTFSLSSTSVPTGTAVNITNTCTSSPTSYTSSDTTIATISGTGITTLKEGTTSIIPIGGSCADITPKTLTVTFACGVSTVADSDTHIYATVAIGAACWMKTNFRSTKTPTGGALLSSTKSANGSTGNDATYGLLYKWSTIMNGSTTEGTQGICPTGWHIPTNTQVLTYTLIPTGAELAGTYDGTSYVDFNIDSYLWSSKSDYSINNYNGSAWVEKTKTLSDYFSLRCLRN
ncbi:hypothetical protein AUK10_03645 [Candidatus Gracilibacteria bacterium CG2_30_37_12]|nr:MAG: hypothetical protein AUK10_03645 [Candidatus Gracilibacteria bacterium CG2_30_37_12]